MRLLFFLKQREAFHFLQTKSSIANSINNIINDDNYHAITAGCSSNYNHDDTGNDHKIKYIQMYRNRKQICRIIYFILFY